VCRQILISRLSGQKYDIETLYDIQNATISFGLPESINSQIKVSFEVQNKPFLILFQRAFFGRKEYVFGKLWRT